MSDKPIAGRAINGLLLLVVLACLFIVMSLHHRYYNDQLRDALRADQQQRGQSILFSIEQAIKAKQDLLLALSSSSNTFPLKLIGDQQQLTLSLTGVDRLCLINATTQSTSTSGCLPVSYATLNSLRQLQQQPVSAMALVQPNTPQAHILLAAKADNNQALLMSVQPNWLKALIASSILGQGYAEIVQGESNTAIAQFGETGLKQGGAVFSQPIANSHWRLQVWLPLPAESVSWWYGLLALSLIVALLWFWRDLIYRRQLQKDVAVLETQIADLTQQQLKPSYFIVNPVLQRLRDTIQNMVLKRSPVRETIFKAETSTDITTEREQLPVQSPPSETAIEAHSEMEAETALEFESMLVESELKPISTMLDEAIVIKTPPAIPTEALPDPAIFRKYDIRGVVDEQLSDEVMFQLGQAIGSEVLEQGFNKLMMGRDGRLSSQAFADALKAGVLSTGCHAVDVGLVPTPVLYFICEQAKTYCGAMITGSHNPANFNGVKVVINRQPLEGAGVKNLYARLRDNRLSQGFGVEYVEEAVEPYLKQVKRDIQLAKPLKVVVDCGNGVAGMIAPRLFRELGCEVIPLYCEVDGHFPHHHPNPGQPENLQDLIETVQSQHADLGIAFDGDGDRIGVVDAHGQIIWPDRLLLILAQSVLTAFPGRTVIYDVKSTSLLTTAIEQAGGKALMTATGHSVIRNKMIEEDAILGGELSGHVFFRDRWYGFDDALYCAARLLELIAADEQGRSASERLSALPERVDTPEIFVPMQEGENQLFVEQMQQQAVFENGNIIDIDGLRVEFKHGWGLVRASNTVPGLTLRFEAESEQTLNEIKQLFKQQMRRIKPTLILNF